MTSERPSRVASEPGGPSHDRTKPAAPAPLQNPATDLLGLQRSVGNRVVARLFAGAPPIPGTRPALQRKILAALAGQPPYSDGLDLATIVSTAVDKPVLPNLVKPKEIAKWEKANKPKKFDPTDVSFMQTGEIHKASFEYTGLATQLPAGYVYQEYDIAKYTSGVRRGPDRIVVGTASNGSKNYYYSSDHYSNFAPFTPPS